LNKKQENLFKDILSKNNSINFIIDYCKKYKISNPIKIYLVGGFVRDFFNNHFEENFDLDIAIDGDINSFSKSLGNELQLNVKKTHGFLNYKIQSDNYNIDLAHCRTEKYLYPGELPTWEKSNIIKDLFRRDITINALAIEIQEKDFKIIDPLNGIEDIDNKLIKIIHSDSFTDDPTRIYRCIRYKARLNFDFELSTKDNIIHSINEVENISKFRKNNEIIKILQENNIEKIIQLIKNCKNLETLFPLRFMGKISFIEKKYWNSLNLIYKIFFAMMDNSDISINEFINSLNFSKIQKKELNKLISIKSRLDLNNTVDIKKINSEEKFISNLYHCL
tara:strand:- start:615 stop:1619 length:1005 start_codon:yes stop_codon:yes gene_type:complete